MKTVSDKPEHQPSETRTLDEVLKSLQDLIRNELLDAEPKPPPPPKIHHGKVGRPRKLRPEPAAEPEPAAPIDLDEVMHSLKRLVSDELDEPAETGNAEQTSSANTLAVSAAETAEPPAGKPLEQRETGQDIASSATPSPSPAHATQPVTAVSNGVQQEFALDPPAEPIANEAASEDIPPISDGLVIEGDITGGDAEQITAESDEDFSVEYPDIEFDTTSDAEAANNLAPAADAGATEDGLTAEEIVLGDVPEQSGPEPDSGNVPNERYADTSAPPPEASIEYEPDVQELEPTPEPNRPLVPENTGPAEASNLSDLIAPPASLSEPEIEIAEQPSSVPESPDAAVPTLGESVNFDDLPVLSDVVVPPPGATPSTPELPFAETENARQLAIRVVARLNIELRKSGERPLDARNIDRLQHILMEELERLTHTPAGGEKKAGSH
jgi:hypothetical protein